MKKIIALLLSVLFLFGVCACGKDSAPDSEPEETAATSGEEFAEQLTREKWLDPETGTVSMEFYVTGSGTRTDGTESDFTWKDIGNNAVRVEYLNNSRMSDFILEEIGGTMNLTAVSGKESFVRVSDCDILLANPVDSSAPAVQDPAAQEPAPKPEPVSGFPEKTIIFNDGIKISTYVVEPAKYVNSFDKIGDWGTQFYFGSSKTSPFELKGAIKNCYGVSFSYRVDSVEGDPFAEGFKAGARKGNKKWFVGDNDELVRLQDGVADEFHVWFKEPDSITAFTVVTGKVLRVREATSWTYELSNDIKLYFKTEDAARLYVDSLVG